MVLPAHLVCLKVCAEKENAPDDDDVSTNATAARQKRRTELPSSCFAMVAAE